jgi:glyoxylase-like metal-dependent hydrolase (beta-lactamase superfamily II)
MAELVPGVHHIRLGLFQAYVYEHGDRLTLIDTGLATSAQAILDAVAGLGRAPDDLRQVVVTHCHEDHTGSLADLAERTGADVLAHRLDAPFIRGEAQAPAPVFTEEEQPFAEQVLKLVPPARPAPVDRELVDGDELDLGVPARVVHVPGHTPGSIAVYVPGRKLLFSGDTAARDLQGNVIVGVFNVDGAQTRASFAKLAALDFEVACFGHGAPLDKDASLAFRKVTYG